MSTSHNGLLVLLHRANQLANELFAETLRDKDFTARQVQVLAAIDANEGLSQTEIAAATSIDRSTLTDVMRRLARRKLIERKRSKDDTRAYTVTLTKAGRTALIVGEPALVVVESEMLAALPSKQRGQLVTMLSKLVASGTARTSDKDRS